MRVHVDKIKETVPYKVSFEREPGTLQPELDALLVELRAAGPLQVEATINRTGKQRLLFEGTMSVTFEGACASCLVELGLQVDAPFCLTLLPESKRPTAGIVGEDGLEIGDGQSAGSFELDAADEDYYEGDEIDLWPLVREQLLLSLPAYLRCGEDCAGLCVVCGTNLNDKDCGCSREVIDPRLAKLREIKLS